MIIKLWKYLHGYVQIKVYGYSPERFINLCANKKIYIWDLKKVSNGYIFCISRKAFFMLRPMVRKTGCRVKIIKKVGLPFKNRVFKKRKIFLIGIILSIGIVTSLSFFIWRIEFDGNIQYTDEEITKLLEENNYKIGSFSPRIKCEEIDDILLSVLPNTMWVSSEIKGTRLIVHMREGIRLEQQVKEDEVCDLVADQNGTIVSIITRTGKPLVAKGDQVKKGDVLVSGTLEIYELTQLMAVSFTHADADVYLTRELAYEDSLATNYIQKEYQEDKIKKDYMLEIVDTGFNLIKPRLNTNNYDRIENRMQLKIIDNFYLPIGIRTIEYKPYFEIGKEYTLEEAKVKLEEKLARKIAELQERDIQITDYHVVYNQDEDSVTAKGFIQVVEKTGQKKIFNEEIRRQQYNEYFTKEDGDTP